MKKNILDKNVTVHNLAKIKSVKNKVLDQEHDVCTIALNKLVKDRHVNSLFIFLKIFEKHCSHEEQILDKFLFIPEKKRINVNNGMSLLLNSRTSHFKDHKKIINSIKEELKKAEINKNSEISVTYLNQLLKDFENHTNVYDAGYADKLFNAIN